ncbi:MAG TPA: BrnT family toxin [Sulfurovum sp.]|nr:BrnT family toxin [Sulfurovum sp.]
MIYYYYANKAIARKNKHHLSFEKAQCAFLDESRIIAEDLDHSQDEKRYFCFGKVDNEIITVRFVYRNNKIRIFGAGYWRKGKKTYEQDN